jgi:hypothetical protein
MLYLHTYYNLVKITLNMEINFNYAFSHCVCKSFYHGKTKCDVLWAGYNHTTGLVTSGYAGCPPCGPSLQAKHSKELKKMIFMGHTKFLPIDHPLRREMNPPDVRPIPETTDGYYWLQTWEALQTGELVTNHPPMTRLSIFYCLPYWEVIIVPLYVGSSR